MKAQFELVIGENKFTLTEEVENHTDFFQKLSFYSTLPKVGPNGETDLVLTYRVAQGQYEYYSIVSKKADQEFKFGQSKTSKGSLFSKGWEPLYKGSDNEESESPTQGAGLGLGSAAPTPASAPQHTGVNPSTRGSTKNKNQEEGKTPQQAPTQVQSQAKSVLSKFGI